MTRVRDFSLAPTSTSRHSLVTCSPGMEDRLACRSALAKLTSYGPKEDGSGSLAGTPHHGSCTVHSPHPRPPP